MKSIVAGFPRLYAAASLKRLLGCGGERGRSGRFPRLYAAASLKRLQVAQQVGVDLGFSAALCRGLIEAESVSRMAGWTSPRFPRLYAAASLKQLLHPLGELEVALVFRGSMPRPH